MDVYVRGLPTPVERSALKVGNVFCSYGDDGTVFVVLAIGSRDAEAAKYGVVAGVILATLNAPANVLFELWSLQRFPDPVALVNGTLSVRPVALGDGSLSPISPPMHGPKQGQILIRPDGTACVVAREPMRATVVVELETGLTSKTVGGICYKEWELWIDWDEEHSSRLFGPDDLPAATT